MFLERLDRRERRILPGAGSYKIEDSEPLGEGRILPGTER